MALADPTNLRGCVARVGSSGSDIASMTNTLTYKQEKGIWARALKNTLFGNASTPQPETIEDKHAQTHGWQCV